MNLFDILACPNCKVHVSKQNHTLKCNQCGLTFPIVDGVPVMFPDGSVPEIYHDSELQVRDTYLPWVNRVILQSLLDDQIVLEIGSGNMSLDDPCIIRMDVKLSPHVDLVADGHALPFLPESLDYIFSLAVVEHLRNPFQAAQSMYDSLKDGGYIYHECNFVFAYHGYPHHYFNASMQGMEQVFSQFVSLRQGVAPYQMPSFALDMLLRTYLHYSHAEEFAHGRQVTSLIHQLVGQDLMQYDIYFSEEEALNVAAGTYYSGVKQKSPTSTLVPQAIQETWKKDDEIHRRFPDINQLTTVDNIMIWAKTDGYKQYPKIAVCLENIVPFNKNGDDAWDRTEIHSLPFQEPLFGAIGFQPGPSMAENAQIAEARSAENGMPLPTPLIQRGVSVLKNEGLGAFMRGLTRKFTQTLQIIRRSIGL